MCINLTERVKFVHQFDVCSEVGTGSEEPGACIMDEFCIFKMVIVDPLIDVFVIFEFPCLEGLDVFLELHLLPNE